MTYKRKVFNWQGVSFMDRTLFCSSMIETFRTCKRAYHLAFNKFSGRNLGASPSSICKRFILRGLAEINRGKLSDATQIQKFMGQHWPIERLNDQVKGREGSTKAFLFAYKTLSAYAARPYQPAGAEVVAVALRVRARIPQLRVYIEETFDLILWHPKERRLEFVQYALKPVKPFDPAWPAPSMLVKQFLAERLKVRWPFERLSMTFCKLGPTERQVTSYTMDDAIFRVHWPEIVKDLEEMKQFTEPAPHAKDDDCPHCQTLENKAQIAASSNSNIVCEPTTKIA